MPWGRLRTSAADGERVMATIEQRRFPYLWEVDTPPGGEGWESTYPYYLVSSEETRAHEQQLFWFQDSMHHPHPYFPFDTITFEAWGMSCGAYSTRVFALPPSRGLDLRLVNGYLYIGAVPVTDPEEIGARAVEFEKRAGHYYANWPDLFARWREKAEAAIHEMEAITIPALPELEDEAVVFEGRGRSSAHDLLSGYTRLVDLFFLVWQYHFEMLNIGYGAYITFFQFCRQAFPTIDEQTIARMVAGIDVLTFRPDEELKGLARKAVEVGVAEAIAGAEDPLAALATLDAQDGGREWLDAFEAAKYPWFNFSSDYGFYHDQLSWIDDLSIPLAGIQGYIRRLQRGEDIARPTEELRRERDRLAEEYGSYLDDENRAQFTQLLELSRTVFPFIEDHNFYVEHWMHTVFWGKMRAIGALLVERGQFPHDDDVFFLNRHELAQVLYDVADAWAVGVEVRRPAHWTNEVARRRERIEALREWTAPPALGAPPEIVTDPFAIMNYGITSERVTSWLGDEPAEGRTSLSGIAGSPGVIEGPARVIRSEKELGAVQEGEILVCTITAPSWGPVFSTIAGVVTDIGGMMCHAAIVCREYGVPAVVGTGFATQSLQTGQRLRVDGGTGEVTVLA
ncbi:MAG: pyruvate, water dikinase [Solirubrobacteraceae bacterium]|nr:pyruvate, water dikinase [Solirubrobacteraceae bacterium]